MMSKSFHRNPRFDPGPFLVAGILLLSLFFAGLFQAALSRAATALVRPLWDAATLGTGILNQKLPTVKTRANLEAQNRALREALTVAEARLANLALVAEENQTLKNLFQGANGRQATVLARVVSPAGASTAGVLVIDRGRTNTTPPPTIGQLVMAADNILLGRVVEVYGASSKVLLWSAAGQRLPVLIGATEIAAEAVGQGGGNYLIELPPTTVVAVGDVVLTGVGRGAVVGTVGRVVHKEAEPFMSVYFRSPLNLKSLHWVLIDESLAQSN